MGLRLSNGIMLFGVASESTNFYYNGNSDQYAHLYAFKPGDADIVEVFKTLRADYKAPTITRGHFVNILEYNDAVWMLGNNLLDPVTVGMVADKSEIAQLQNEEADNLSDALNKLTNTDLLFGVGAFQSNQLRYWSPYRTSQSSDSTTVYSGRSPSTPSLLCEPIATTPGIAVTSLSLSQKVVNRMRGQWITVVAYVHTDLPNEQVGMSVYFGPVSGIQNTIKTTGGWDPITVTVFVPLNAQGMVLNLIPRLSGNSTTKVWFSNTYAMLGALPR